MIGRGNIPLFTAPSAENVLNAIVSAIRYLVMVKRFGVPWDQLLVLSPSHAHLLARAGYDKKAIQKYVYEHARTSLAEIKSFDLTTEIPDWKTIAANKSDDVKLFPMTEKPENLVILVAGGAGTNASTFIPGFYPMLTGEIDRYKPANWQKLIEIARKELDY